MLELSAEVQVTTLLTDDKLSKQPNCLITRTTESFFALRVINHPLLHPEQSAH
jgi:hypothetical protein